MSAVNKFKKIIFVFVVLFPPLAQEHLDVDTVVEKLNVASFFHGGQDFLKAERQLNFVRTCKIWI